MKTIVNKPHVLAGRRIRVETGLTAEELNDLLDRLDPNDVVAVGVSAFDDNHVVYLQDRPMEGLPVEATTERESSGIGYRHTSGDVAESARLARQQAPDHVAVHAGDTIGTDGCPCHPVTPFHEYDTRHLTPRSRDELVL